MSIFWKCPKCQTTLEKQQDVLAVYTPRATIVGTVTCGVCGATFDRSDVHGGKYDVPELPLERAPERDVHILPRIVAGTAVSVTALIFVIPTGYYLLGGPDSFKPGGSPGIPVKIVTWSIGLGLSYLIFRRIWKMPYSKRED
jgi:hypothetical protein